MKTSFKADIAILRLLAIIIVVAFHAYGMCYAEAHLPQPLPKVYQETYEWFNQYIPINVAMPLFVFVSGYLFGMQLHKGKYLSLWEVAKDKFLRLLVPYYFFVPIMMATYSGFLLGPYYTGNYWHLWFLPMLWWMFVVTFLLRAIIFSDKKWILFGLILISYGCALLGDFRLYLFGLHGFNKLFCYFLLGIAAIKYEELFISAIKNYHLFYPLTIVYGVTIIWFPTEYGDMSLALLIGTTCAIIVLWYLFHIIPWNSFKITPYLLSVSACSFGIYIFHNWMEVYLISSTAQRLFPIAEFASQHIILFPLLFTIAAFVVSLILTKLMLKTNIGQMLFGAKRLRLVSCQF